VLLVELVEDVVPPVVVVEFGSVSSFLQFTRRTEKERIEQIITVFRIFLIFMTFDFLNVNTLKLFRRSCVVSILNNQSACLRKNGMVKKN
jgi:hypothetical protein